MTPAQVEATLRSKVQEWLRNNLLCTAKDSCAYDHTCDLHKELDRRIFPAMAQAMREAVTQNEDAEIEIMNGLGETVDALRAEVDGLRKLAAIDAETIEQYAVEIERLRALVDEIADVVANSYLGEVGCYRQIEEIVKRPPAAPQP